MHLLKGVAWFLVRHEGSIDPGVVCLLRISSPEITAPGQCNDKFSAKLLFLSKACASPGTLAILPAINLHTSRTACCVWRVVHGCSPTVECPKWAKKELSKRGFQPWKLTRPGKTQNPACNTRGHYRGEPGTAWLWLPLRLRQYRVQCAVCV
jgi:hypothetical protein